VLHTDLFSLPLTARKPQQAVSPQPSR